MCMIPSSDPFSVTALPKKMANTMYGSVAVTYTAWWQKGKEFTLTPVPIRDFGH